MAVAADGNDSASDPNRLLHSMCRIPRGLSHDCTSVYGVRRFNSAPYSLAHLVCRRVFGAGACGYLHGSGDRPIHYCSAEVEVALTHAPHLESGTHFYRMCVDGCEGSAPQAGGNAAALPLHDSHRFPAAMCTGQWVLLSAREMSAYATTLACRR